MNIAAHFCDYIVTNEGAMQWLKIKMNTYRQKTPFANRPRQRSSNSSLSESRDVQNARRNYERYLTLAQAQAQAGDVIGAENYYQHAEHYFRSMRAETKCEGGRTSLGLLGKL